MKLNVRQQFGLGFLSLPISLIIVSVLTFVPTYYALDLEVGLAATGFIFAFGRILDVITDPLIGHLSDQTSSPLGKRLPWMLAGGLILCPIVYGIMTPSVGPSVVFLATIVGVFFLAVTLLDLPFSAVGLEISPLEHERTIIAAVKAVFQVLGALVAPIIILVFADNLSLGLRYTAFITIALILLGLFIFIALTPFKNQQEQSFTPRTSLRFSPLNALRDMRVNREYLRLILAFGLAQAGTAMIAGLTALLVAKHYKTPELTGVFIAIVLLSSAAGLPLWVYMAKKFGKARSWQIGLISGLILMVTSVAFLGGALWLFGIFCALFGLIVSSDVILPTTMLADIVSDNSDIGSESGKPNDAGAMLGFKNAVSKLGFVGPMLFAFPVLGFLGVESSESLSGKQYMALLSFYVLVPATLRFLAVWVFTGSMKPCSRAETTL